MINAGCDVHDKYSMVSRLDDETGELSGRYQVATSEVCEHLMGFGPDITVAVETSTAGLFVARKLQSLGVDVILVDSFKGRRLLEALNNRKHTDKLDALGLMWLLAKGYLEHAQVWIPDDATVELRELVRAREALVHQGVTQRNQVRNILSRHGLRCPYTDLLGRGAREWFAELNQKLPPKIAFVVNELYQALVELDAHIQRLSARVNAEAAAREETQLLMTIPGIGPILAATIVAEIGDVKRFKHATNLRSYARLVPREDQSGDRLRRGPLVKHGNRLLSWAFVQAAGHFASCKRNSDLRLTKKYRQTVFKHGPNPAKVSLGRHLVDVVFAMLRDGEPFDATRHLPPSAAQAPPPPQPRAKAG